ncbi:hypothetical protein DFH11DRAFT_1751848 [Phellopilus nigrolimitatus]|nr:hypothetical protein DFH11DRAFT_1751848 [Phellopilus nigrolimitatus]
MLTSSCDTQLDDLRQRRPLFFFSAAAVDPLLNHVAQLTAAQTPSQLALLLSSALADADALRRELTVAQSRATSTKCLLASVQGFHSSASPGPIVDGEKASGEREKENGVKVESRVPESTVKAVPTLRHARTVLSVSARRSNGTSTRVLTPLRRRAHRFCAPPLDGIAHPVAYPLYPTVASSESPHELRNDTLILPSLPLPHAIGALSSGSSMLTGPGTSRRRHVLCTPSGSRTRTRSQQSASFHLLPLLPPPSATELSMSVARVVPAKRSHRSRSGRGTDELFNGEFDEKRRRVDGWDTEVDSPSLSPSQRVRTHVASPPMYGTHTAAWTAHAAPPLPPGGYDAGREHIRVDARELVRDAKERERRGRVTTNHHAPGVDYYPKAALQGPNIITPGCRIRPRPPPSHAIGKAPSAGSASAPGTPAKTAMCSAGTPSTSAMPVGARGNSNWRGDARARIGAAANAHSAADLKKEGDDITGGRSGVGQGQNAEGDDDSAEGAIASAGVGFGSGSGGRTASTVAHDRV